GWKSGRTPSPPDRSGPARRGVPKRGPPDAPALRTARTGRQNRPQPPSPPPRPVPEPSGRSPTLHPPGRRHLPATHHEKPNTPPWQQNNQSENCWIFSAASCAETTSAVISSDRFRLKAKRRDTVLRESRTRRASDCELAPDRPTCGRRGRDGASVIRSTGQRQLHPKPAAR